MLTIDSNKTTVGSPHPTVDLIVVFPLYETIKDLHVQLHANAESIVTNLGDGQHGFFCLTISDEQYNSVSTASFVQPFNPGPSTPSEPNATSTQIKKIYRQTCTTN